MPVRDVVSPRYSTSFLGIVLLGSIAGAALAREPAGLLVDGGASNLEDAGFSEAGADAAVEAIAKDPRITRIRDFMAGKLDLDVQPQSLFDVPIDDENAIGIEALRIRAFLRVIDENVPPVASASSRTRPAPVPSVLQDIAAIRAEAEALPPGQFEARLELDRARLDFYSLAKERRNELLQMHADRREAAKPKETEEQKRAREAEAERKRVLEAARAARTEAERLVSEELGRIIGVEHNVILIRDRIRTEREDAAKRLDVVFGVQRRVKDAKLGSAADADSTYDDLRRQLRSSRDVFATALDTVQSGRSDVPDLGPNPLTDIPADVSTVAVTERRRTIETLIRDVRRDEHAWHEEYAVELREEIATLNRERLGLMPYLSPAKRSALTGFTPAAWDQARAETRHLSLVLRHHWHVATSWIAALREGPTPWKSVAWLIPWFMLVAVFLIWRRRSGVLLTAADERLMARDRAERRTMPSFARRGMRFLAGIRTPGEWLLFCALTWGMLPADTRGLLEIQLVTVVIGWILVGSLVVHFINALAVDSALVRTGKPRSTADLRLRSLRLVGRVVVSFALVLVLCARLVGEGTIYAWVYSWCWIAAIPVFLILVRWWRRAVFERVAQTRRSTPFYKWVLANRSGWKSFVAAMLAAVQLFFLGTIKAVRGWVASFDVARRAHAYLFRRELDRIAGETKGVDIAALPADVLEILDPEAPHREWVPCGADKVFEALRERIKSGQGGVVAIVGGRGLGKSSLLRRLQSEFPAASSHACTENSSAMTIREAIEKESSPRSVVLLDEAQMLAKPILGGLREFDATLAYARAHGDRTVWVLALDSVLWSFLKRARDARPMFDEVWPLPPWNEEEIATLLMKRSEIAELEPTLEDLLDKLPASADDFDKQEALAAKRTGYFRMVWDHCQGNPGMSLEVWRSSLCEAADGSVRVRPLQVPDTRVIESLSDSALFVLRAVLQLSRASIRDITQATRLPEAEVVSSIRFGEAHGYFVMDGNRVIIPWRWLRSVLQLLERRHLLVNP